MIWLLLHGCMAPRLVTESLLKSEQTLVEARRVYARKCAPIPLAHARANRDFARLELQQGDVRRARDHALEGERYATKAVQDATACGKADRDNDRVPDIVDTCPDEPEDYDGIADNDGCRDIDPAGDEDRDGVINIDDGCVDVPEDLDGDNDTDGCPETSDDSDGDGRIDAVDPCPDQAEDVDGFQDEDGCPEIDNDLDGVVDLRDGCPNIPEDPDGWADEDGCPEFDDDLDGVADAQDACPREPGPIDLQGCPSEDGDADGISDTNDQCPAEPETKNGYLDDDGCPDEPPRTIKVTQTRVEITDTIEFRAGSATLLPQSYPLLDEVVKVLVDVPDMALEIQGHTDSQGSDAANLELSRERAVSVRLYLESKGIVQGRLTSIGKGELEPIDTNRTTDGRARNRRVEFHIRPSAPAVPQ